MIYDAIIRQPGAMRTLAIEPVSLGARRRGLGTMVQGACVGAIAAGPWALHTRGMRSVGSAIGQEAVEDLVAEETAARGEAHAVAGHFEEAEALGLCDRRGVEHQGVHAEAGLEARL